MPSETPSVDYRTQRADSAEGTGVARARRSEFLDTVDEHTLADAYPLVGDRAASVEDLDDTVRDDIAGQVLKDADLLGFWLAWHHAGGFASLQAAGWHRATIFRKVKNFRDRYGEHPDTYQPDWIHLDLPAAWTAEISNRLERNRGRQ